MRFRNYSLALLLLAAACKKKDDETVARTGPNVTSAALAQQMAPGSFQVYNRFTTNVAGVLPATGTGQTWNFSTLTNGIADTMRFVTASNSTFPSATYARTQTVDFGVGGTTQPITISTFYQVSDQGWFELGRSLPPVNFNSSGAVINFNAQSNAYSSKMPWTPALPAYDGDTSSFTSIIQESGTVTVPNTFFINTPVALKTTNSGGVKVVGSGALQFPGITTPVNAVLIRRTFTRTLNFLLNGSTPPATLLAPLGITDGQQTAVVSYDFYGQGNEGYLGSVYRENGTTLYAYFRKY